MTGILLTKSNAFIIGPVSQLLGYLMNGIFTVLEKIGIPSIGLAIIIFTLVIYLCMMPLTVKQQKFSKLSAKDINVDIILQSIGHDGKKDISFTVAKNRGEEAVALMKEYTENLGAEEILYDDKVAKISIVGAGMESHAGVATKMFEALYDAQVNIQMISTSEIKVSVLIDSADADKAVSAIHSKFFD